MTNIKRVKTGVTDFDELIEGGIPKCFNVIFTGGSGTGKI
jgi:KaiC/GvpD/RAD55 family RecA-like ATPase